MILNVIQMVNMKMIQVMYVRIVLLIVLHVLVLIQLNVQDVIVQHIFKNQLVLLNVKHLVIRDIIVMMMIEVVTNVMNPVKNVLDHYHHNVHLV